MISPERIHEIAERKSSTALGYIRIVNAIYRRHDESHLFPINGNFNVTERAIRRARKYRGQGIGNDGYEYILLLENILSEIVNKECL